MIQNYARFGAALAPIGDWNLDGVPDLAVGSWRDPDGGRGRGAVWILFLWSDGTVRSHQKISDLHGGFQGHLDTDDFFGVSVTRMTDLDQDSIYELAVGAYSDDDGGSARGAVWILFMHIDGTVKSH